MTFPTPTQSPEAAAVERLIERLRTGTRILTAGGPVEYGPPAIRIEAADALAALQAENARLREGLTGWKCPSCGGSKAYMNNSRYGSQVLPCKVCEQTGLHPDARTLLNGEPNV